MSAYCPLYSRDVNTTHWVVGCRHNPAISLHVHPRGARTSHPAQYFLTLSKISNMRRGRVNTRRSRAAMMVFTTFGRVPCRMMPDFAASNICCRVAVLGVCIRNVSRKLGCIPNFRRPIRASLLRRAACVGLCMCVASL